MFLAFKILYILFLIYYVYAVYIKGISCNVKVRSICHINLEKDYSSNENNRNVKFEYEYNGQIHSAVLANTIAKDLFVDGREYEGYINISKPNRIKIKSSNIKKQTSTYGKFVLFLNTIIIKFIVPLFLAFIFVQFNLYKF